jgi:hypothetical protein
MFKKNFAAIPAAFMLPLVLTAALLFTACPQPTDSDDSLPIIPANLAKYFQSLPYSADYAFYDDGFVVNAWTKTFYYYGNSTLETKWGGPIVEIVPEGDAYIMIVKIAEVTGSWSPPPEKGRYFAAAYKNLTGSRVNSSTAYKSDGNNTGLATVEEAVSEYTIANGYFDYLDTTQYYPHTASAVTLAALQGNWVTNDEGYYINIKGTKLTEWMEGGIYDGVYGTDSEDILGKLGDIVDHTNITKTSGVLYIRIIASDDNFTPDKYIAIAWKDKTASGISFTTSNTEYDTLAAVKSARNNANNKSQFPDGSFNNYTRE